MVVKDNNRRVATLAASDLAPVALTFDVLSDLRALGSRDG